MSVEQRTTFRDLQAHANAGFAKRVIARYLMPTNYERSIKWHERLGTPLAQHAVMSSVGKLAAPNSFHYHMSQNKSVLEATTDFATKGSAFSETFHTISLALSTVPLIDGVFEGYDPLLTFGALSMFAYNIPLIALQRYNRARMVRTADKELKRGRSFSSEYKNWLGIDARAVENFNTANEK